MAPFHRVRSVFSLCLHTPVRQSWFSRSDGTTISALPSQPGSAATVAGNKADTQASPRATSSTGRQAAIPGLYRDFSGFTQVKPRRGLKMDPDVPMADLLR